MYEAILRSAPFQRICRSWWLVVLCSPLIAAEPPTVDFNRDIRPILSDRCFACHGPDEAHREADLRLDQEASAKEDRGGYAAVVPGQIDDSELWRRITSEDPEERMPPESSGKTMEPDELETIRHWIEEGAQWSAHWSYLPPTRHPLPTVRNIRWPQNWVDSFVLAKLEAFDEAPRPASDRIALVRRLCFDLTGLPPTPDQRDAFLADDSPAAYERFVDSLLASPAYGERMAMYWLDLVRYADTVGYHGDQDHPISPYRDYVIESFHANLPFDVFTREQLAGDLLPDSQQRQKIASAYNRVLQTSHEGGVQPMEYRAIYAADRVRNVSAVWLAATLGCAQCHDHKYDPFTSADFYSMAAFFADIDDEQHFKVGTDTVPTARPPVLELLTDEESSLKCMITVALDEPRVIRILQRGNWLDESGPVVAPNVPPILGSLGIDDRRATRLDLANWLTDPNGAGGMTARVFANRVWYLLLGRGISPSLDDLGSQGTPPTHPELLDRLAIEFIEHDWDVKHLVKRIVTSRTYQQSCLPPEKWRKHGPPDRLAASYPARQRLPAEMVRDSALLVSGLLNRQMGGRSARPYQPEGYYRHLNFPEREYQHDTNANQWRRGVYVHWQRQFLHPMLRAFDAPSREECTAARQASNTPLAALVLLNDPTFLEAARVFAQRIMNEGGDSFDEQLHFAFQQLLSRAPESAERALLQQLWRENAERYTLDPEAARQFLSIGLTPLSVNVNGGGELFPGGELSSNAANQGDADMKKIPDPLKSDVAESELAAWTVVARVLFNLDEAITKG